MSIKECTRCSKCGLPRSGHFDRKSRAEKRRIIVRRCVRNKHRVSIIIFTQTFASCAHVINKEVEAQYPFCLLPFTSKRMPGCILFNVDRKGTFPSTNGLKSVSTISSQRAHTEGNQSVSTGIVSFVFTT